MEVPFEVVFHPQEVNNDIRYEVDHGLFYSIIYGVIYCSMDQENLLTEKYKTCKEWAFRSDIVLVIVQAILPSTST